MLHDQYEAHIKMMREEHKQEVNRLQAKLVHKDQTIARLQQQLARETSAKKKTLHSSWQPPYGIPGGNWAAKLTKPLSNRYFRDSDSWDTSYAKATLVPVNNRRGGYRPASAAKMLAMRTSIELEPAPPFDFDGTAYSHGWVVLAPNTWDAEEKILRRVEQLASGKVVLVSVRGRGTPREPVIQVEIESPVRLGANDRDVIAAGVSHMFRLHEDLGAFHRICRKRGGPWKAVTKGLGRLLRSPGLFEDIVKVICTTNIQWGGTKSMVAGLVKAHGKSYPGRPELQAFPAPATIAALTPAEFGESVRMGYRAPYVHELAQRITSGQLSLEALLDPEIPTPELKKRLLEIKGAGNYAVATLLMLLGRYDDLGVDTVARDFVARKYFGGRRPSDTQVVGIYADWGEWKYLAYWFDLWAGLNE